MSDNEADVDDLFGSDSGDDDDQQQKHRGATRVQDEEEDLNDEDADQPRPTARRLLSPEPTDSGGSDADDDRRRSTRPTAPPMEIEAPLLPLPPSDKIHLIKTSNILGIESRPFDPATYQVEEDSYGGDAGSRRQLPPEAIIRWRYRKNADGTEVRESNARFVRWSDGSLQLLLGDEPLDVQPQDISQSSLYLYAVRSILQGQAHLTSKLALRPASLDSKLHKRLRDGVDKRHQKVQKVSRFAGLSNPEVDKARREAMEEERIKNRETLQRKQERVSQRYGGGARARPARLSEGYLEEEQEWEEGGFDDMDDDRTATQRARDALRRRGDDEMEAEAARRLQNAKRAVPQSKKRRADSEEEEEEEEYVSEPEEEGSEDERGKAKMKARRGVVLSDDDDD